MAGLVAIGVGLAALLMVVRGNRKLREHEGRDRLRRRMERV
jgi:hypothetical protein